FFTASLLPTAASLDADLRVAASLPTALFDLRRVPPCFGARPRSLCFAAVLLLEVQSRVAVLALVPAHARDLPQTRPYPKARRPFLPQWRRGRRSSGLVERVAIRVSSLALNSSSRFRSTSRRGLDSPAQKTRLSSRPAAL